MDKGLIIFDLDGTLIDTIGDLSAAVEHALRCGGFPGHSVDEYRRMVGHGIRNLVSRALPVGTPENVIEETLSEFVRYYTAHIDVLSRPYEGIHELLAVLRSEGVKLAVASNKFQEGTEALVRRFFPDIEFALILGNSPDLPLKPDPGVVKMAIEAAGTIKAVMVGDSATDIKTARNAGIPVVAVSWGFRPRTDLIEADAVADTPAQLGRMIRDSLTGNAISTRDSG